MRIKLPQININFSNLPKFRNNRSIRECTDYLDDWIEFQDETNFPFVCKLFLHESHNFPYYVCGHVGFTDEYLISTDDIEVNTWGEMKAAFQTAYEQLLERYEAWVREEILEGDLCEHYRAEDIITNGVVLFGSQECNANGEHQKCSCGGDKSKCDFYKQGETI